jgi:DNA polymerase-3 subunit beta
LIQKVKEALLFLQNCYWKSLKHSQNSLNFTVEENSTIEISSNSGKYALAYAPGDEFPKSVNLDDPSVTLVPADVLATAISKIFAAGNDDLRPVMSGVFSSFLHKD